MATAIVAAGGLSSAANAAPGPVQLDDATTRLTERGAKARPASPIARRAIPLLTPDPAKLRRAKARAAEDLADGPRRSPRILSPLPSPKASVLGGLNKLGMAAVGNTTPPDTTGAIGPSHYVEFVNGTGIAAYDRNLNLLAGPLALEEFIGFPEDSVFDPQIQWDAEWGRWIYAMDDVEEFENEFGEIEEEGYLAFGWSKSADPSELSTEFPGEGAGAGWCEYFIATGELLDDYPKLGHADAGITIGTNVFAGESLLGSRLWSIAKPPSPQSCPALAESSIGVSPFLKTADGDEAFTPVPANTADGSAVSYVVAADSPFLSADSQIMAWHISGAGAGATLIGDGNMEVGPYEFPASVPQEGTAEAIDTLDARLTNAVAVTDPAVGQEAVWTQHTVDGPGGRSVVRWYELLPATGSVRQEGTVSDPEHFVFNAAISPTKRGDAAAINFNVGSETLFPEIHAQSRDSETPLDQMEGDVLLGESAGAAQDFSCETALAEPCRWGDYAGASPDPARAAAVWGSNQALAGPSGEDARWTTRNFALFADSTVSDLIPPPAPTITATDPSGPANENSPAVRGSAEAGSTVRLYKSTDCSGPVRAQGSAGSFGSPGLTVSVADNATTQLTATATDPVGNTSSCSAPFAYTEDSSPLPALPEEPPVAPLPPPVPLSSSAGVAVAAGAAQVRGRKALLSLRCPGSGACAGRLRLVARVKSVLRRSKGKRRRKGARRSPRRARNIAIGRAGFAIAAGGSVAVLIPLTGRGKALFDKAGRRGLPVKLRGSGVASRRVRLKAAAPTCGEARRLARAAQREIARAKRALANAGGKDLKRVLRKRLRQKKRALRKANRQRVRACGRAENRPGSTAPGGTPNHPPEFPGSVRTEAETKFHYDDSARLDGATTTLKVLSPATDPDGDPIVYSWSATNGSIAGNGLTATWERSIAFGQPAAGIATIAASDGKGGADQFEFRFN